MKHINDNIVKRYRKSIYIDLLVSFIPMCILIFNTNHIVSYFGEFGKLIMFGLVLLFMFFYLISDIVFKNKSIGKRVYHLKVISALQEDKINFYFIIFRRVLECFYNPLFGKSFYDKYLEMENRTGTRIIND
ncbi:MAG: RDD family protein [Tenericutes bacterium]|nr:RDD family protein [Mycoplasmatota bacterium]